MILKLCLQQHDNHNEAQNFRLKWRRSWRLSPFVTWHRVVWYIGRTSPAGLATGWTIRGSNPGGDEIFRTCPDRLWGPPSLLYCTMGTESFPGIKSGRGVTLTLHPFLLPRSRKSKAIPLLPPMGHTACTEPQCLYKGELYLLHLPQADRHHWLSLAESEQILCAFTSFSYRHRYVQ